MVGGSREELLGSLFSASPDAVVVADSAGVITVISPSATTLFGYDPDELIGHPVELLLPEHTRTRHVRHRESFAASPTPRPMGAGLQLEGRRKDGTVFPVDVSLAPTTVAGELRIGAYVRDATQRRRGEDLLRFVNDVSQQALTFSDTSVILELICARAQELVTAAVVWVAVPGATGSSDLTVTAAHGAAADRLVGAVVPKERSLAWEAIAENLPVVVGDLHGDERGLPQAREAGFGPAAYLPMLADEGPIGALVAARTGGSPVFDSGEVAALKTFAAATAVVIALAQARESVEEMRMLSEQERIARDLHDSVIQRLFALGMQLQATQRLSEAGPFTDRLTSAVETIDEVIREIRETIFDLSNPDTSLLEVRRQVREVVDAAAEQLGFSPRVSFRGPVESAVSDKLSLQILAALRESLTNCSKHAHASAIDVVVAASDGWLTLSVADNGSGIGDGPSAGNGLANMRARAEGMGGTFSATRRSPSGTLVQWRVPVSGAR